MDDEAPTDRSSLTCNSSSLVEVLWTRQGFILWLIRFVLDDRVSRDEPSLSHVYPRCFADALLVHGSSSSFASDWSLLESKSSVSVLTSWDVELVLFELAMMPKDNEDQIRLSDRLSCVPEKKESRIGLRSQREGFVSHQRESRRVESIGRVRVNGVTAIKRKWKEKQEEHERERVRERDMMTMKMAMHSIDHWREQIVWRGRYWSTEGNRFRLNDGSASLERSSSLQWNAIQRTPEGLSFEQWHSFSSQILFYSHPCLSVAVEVVTPRNDGAFCSSR